MSGGSCGGWRYGKGSIQFVTTRVNNGDRPAGCIAIASVWETAERFRKGRDEAAWFLKNQTYVDDTSGGVHDKENAIRVPADMNSIIENGGFQSKETVMSGDPLDKRGELRKAMGLR
jgi:hypothetical protein